MIRIEEALEDINYLEDTECIISAVDFWQKLYSYKYINKNVVIEYDKSNETYIKLSNLVHAVNNEVIKVYYN